MLMILSLSICSATIEIFARLQPAPRAEIPNARSATIEIFARLQRSVLNKHRCKCSATIEIFARLQQIRII